MIIVVNGNAHHGDRQYADACISMIKEKYKKENVNAIYAVEKDDIVYMKKELFPYKKLMDQSIADYKRQGFKVYYTERRVK